MAIAMEERRRPLPLQPLGPQPLMVQPYSRSDAPSDESPPWSAAPLSAFPRPQLLLPDSADEERVLEIDQQALLNLRSFRNQPCGSAGAGFSPMFTMSPSSANSFERRHSLAESPSSPLFSSIEIPVSPASRPQFARRRSAPFAGRRATPEAGMVMVVPQQLSRPMRPLTVTPDLEIWWPVQPCGEIKIHVGIMTRRGQAERLTRCLPPSRLQHSAESRSLPQTPQDSMDAGQNVMPGSVLPIPGEIGAPSGRRFSTGWSPSTPSSPRPFGWRHSSHLDFPVQLINKERAVRYLSLLGAIITQSKRPIQGDEQILMPMPYPSAWPDTIEYIHSGHREHLSEMVKSNLLHLGGRV